MKEEGRSFYHLVGESKCCLFDAEPPKRAILLENEVKRIKSRNHRNENSFNQTLSIINEASF